MIINTIKKNLSLIKLLILSKWIFKFPCKKKFLIYDGISIENLFFLFKKKEYEIFHTRYEQINISVLIYTIFKSGIFKIREKYKINYFKFVKPKIILTWIDENPGFFKLKSIYPHARFISIQRAFKDNNFYDYIKNYTKKNKNFKFKADYSFVLGENDLLKYSNFVSGKIISLGNIKNNNHPIKKNYKGPINEITFISSLPVLRKNLKFQNHRNYKIFLFLKKYCEDNNIKLRLLSKHGSNFEKLYREIYNGGKWQYLPRENVSRTYKILNNSKFIIFDNTTLGYEALTKNIKGVCFPEKFPYKSYSKSYNHSGFFWSQKLNEKILYKKIDHVINMKNKIWKKKIKDTVGKIIFYNPNNKVLKNTIKKII